MVMSKALCIGYLRTTFWNKFGGEIALAIEDGTGVGIMDLLHCGMMNTVTRTQNHSLLDLG